MSYFLKRKDRFRRIIVEGVGFVLHFSSGEVVKESAPSSLGQVRYYCRIMGGAVRVSEDVFHRETYTFYIWNSHPCAAIVKNLHERDLVRVAGIYEQEYYISEITHTRKMKRYVKIEYIEPFGNTSNETTAIQGALFSSHSNPPAPKNNTGNIDEDTDWFN